MIFGRMPWVFGSAVAMLFLPVLGVAFFDDDAPGAVTDPRGGGICRGCASAPACAEVEEPFLAASGGSLRFMPSAPPLDPNLFVPLHGAHARRDSDADVIRGPPRAHRYEVPLAPTRAESACPTARSSSGPFLTGHARAFLERWTVPSPRPAFAWVEPESRAPRRLK